MLDFPPFELPSELRRTYAVPDDVDAVAAANRATADLLAAASASASASLGADVVSPLAQVVRNRLTSSPPAREEDPQAASIPIADPAAPVPEEQG